jgi:hypothetical protein
MRMESYRYNTKISMLCCFERIILSLGVLGRLAPLRGVFQRNTQKLKLMGLSLMVILTTNTYDMFPIVFHHVYAQQ